MIDHEFNTSSLKTCQIPGPVSPYLEQFACKLFIGFSSFTLGVFTLSWLLSMDYNFYKGIFALFPAVFLVSKTVLGA